MKPFDPRLLRYAHETRGYIIFLVILGITNTALIAAQIFFISAAASSIFYGTGTFNDIQPLLWLLLGAFLLRAILTYIQKAVGHRSAVKVIAHLRTQVLRHAGDLGDRWLSQGNSAKVVTHTTRGLDDLEAYFVSFLPELFLCVTATPLLIAVIFIFLDWISAVAIVLCIPLIPIFMILIGKMTAHYSGQRLKAMAALGTQLLDLLSGLSTLKALGREQGPKKRVRELGRNFAHTTMQTLYVAFLSGAALEFIATLSTAIIAVEVGFRMVASNLFLFEGLAIIMLTPEVFRPLREVGTQFHASSNGLVAAQQAFTVLETPIEQHTGQRAVPDMRTAVIQIEDLSIFAPGRATVAPSHLNANIPPGKITVFRGSSGAGKSTTIHVLLALLQPHQGRVLIDGIDLNDLDRADWWRHITWVPQQPAIVPGTIISNMRSDTANSEDFPLPEDDAALQRACSVTGFDTVINSLAEGWNTHIGHGGVGLSVGQRQRLALTRALISTADIVILDEPSAHLDAVSEEYVTRALIELKEAGRTVIVIAHRAAIAQLADNVIDVSSSTRDISEEIAQQRHVRAQRIAAAKKRAAQIDYTMPSSWSQRERNE